MAKESVLTREEKESIEIERLIFHIIISEKQKPDYLEEVIITEEQKHFFKNRLIDIAQGTQYDFVDKPNNEVFKKCKDIVDNPESNFIESSKRLAGGFHKLHSKNMNDGVFVIVLANISGNKKLVFLIKMDHKLVYSYKQKGDKASLEEVKNTFIEDKSAIQKVALVDVTENYKWDLLAYDKQQPSSLTAYFEKYLTVEASETPFKLTGKAITFAYQWAAANKQDLCQEVSTYKTRAINYLKEASIFNTEDFVDRVIYEEDSDKKNLLMESFSLFLQEKGIAGQTFKPNKNAIKKGLEKSVRQTAEGVKIEWEGEAQNNNIEIPKERGKDGCYHIVIKTSDIKELK